MKSCKFFPLIVAVMKISLATSQVYDDFNDQNITHNPNWLGDTSAFIVNDQMQLQLQAPSEGASASLFTFNKALKNTTWQIDIFLDFNPSSSNYLDWYLASNLPELSDYLSGYFIRIGNTEDEISLYYKQGGEIVEIIDGIDDVLDKSIVEISIRVTYENEIWTIEYKPDGPTNWINGGSAPDNTYSGSSYSGMICHYTSTRADKFRFDNFIVSGIAENHSAPQISQIIFTGSSQLQCSFDQPVITGLLHSDKITVGNNDINPEQIEILDEQNIILQFPQSLVDQKQYTLTFSSLTSYHLTEVENLKHTFTFEKPYIAQKGDLLITEFMADPTPGNGLPEYEYLEIANVSGKTLNNQKILISVNENIIETPVFDLAPGEHLILAEPEAVEAFGNYGKCVALDLPTIINDGSLIAIYNLEHKLLHEIDFDKSWYRDKEKATGGYALELIDTSSMCIEHASNWIASFEAKGGSPGQPNTANQFYSDTKMPSIKLAKQSSSNEISILFDEVVSNFGRVSVQYETELDTAYILHGISDNLLVVTSDSLPRNNAFQVMVKNLEDCFNNVNSHDSATIIIPSEQHDDAVLFSEIVFNAGTKTPEYLELYNNSDAYIDLQGWSILVYKDESSEVKTLEIDSATLLYPETFIAITSYKDKLVNAFPHAHKEQIIELDLPNFWDDQGIIELWQAKDSVVEKMNYSEEMHHYRIEDTDGVALERISWEIDADQGTNWVSASSSVQFGTPTLPNSQHMAHIPSEQIIYIEHRSFSPDQDGYRDFLKIDLNLPKSGLTVHAEIFDFRGELVRSLALDALLGSETHLIWDGQKRDGSIASPGNYLLYLEILENGRPLFVNREKIVLYYP